MVYKPGTFHEVMPILSLLLGQCITNHPSRDRNTECSPKNGSTNGWLWFCGWPLDGIICSPARGISSDIAWGKSLNDIVPFEYYWETNDTLHTITWYPDTCRINCLCTFFLTTKTTTIIMTFNKLNISFDFKGELWVPSVNIVEE